MIVLFTKPHFILTLYFHNLSGTICLTGGTTHPKAGLKVPLRNLTKKNLSKNNYGDIGPNHYNITKTDRQLFDISTYQKFILSFS